MSDAEAALDRALDDYAGLIERGELLRTGERSYHGEIIRAFDILGEEVVLAETFTEAVLPLLPDQGRSPEEKYENSFNGKLGEIIFKKFCLAHGVQVFADSTIRERDDPDEGDILDAEDFTLDLDIKTALPFHKSLFVKWSSPHYSIYVVVLLALKHNRAKVEGWVNRKTIESNTFCEGDTLPDTRGKKARYGLYGIALKDLYSSDEELRVLLEKIKSGRLRKKEGDDAGQSG